ncbi:histidinol dehydrogenase [Candidatus Gracilibacteria bacterium]|nr:histidinol dehydrogenase [Candidatus Gracilibacteria bacterium]
MKKYYLNNLENIDDLLRRPGSDASSVMLVVQEIMVNVRENGDDALQEYSMKFDGVEIDSLKVADFETAWDRVDERVKNAMMLAADNIKKFHAAQITPPLEIETMPGVKCSRVSRPIERVGLYIPGGTAPLPSTVLMLAIPAVLAGCEEIILCSPPFIADEILCAAKIAGVNKIYQIGGAQAIAAMAYGTESIPKVDKIFGPGNQYVTAAKMLVQAEGVAIDMPAGPSEVLIIADREARADFVASDLLSQAEHGPDSQVVLVCTDEAKADEVLEEMDAQLAVLPRKDIAAEALNNSFVLIVDNLDQAMEFSNQYAPEHLILNVENPDTDSIKNAGSVFLGQYSCESAGDYASGTNHTLPTYGYAKSYSGVSVDSFVKKITFQELTKEGVKNIGPAVEILAECEGLQAHKNAMTLRLNQIKLGKLEKTFRS